MSAPQPMPIAEILLMTSSAYAQEDINNWLFAPDRKALESKALGLLKTGSAPRSQRPTSPVPVHRHKRVPACPSRSGDSRTEAAPGQGALPALQVLRTERCLRREPQSDFLWPQFWDRICLLEVDSIEEAKTEADLPPW